MNQQHTQPNPQFDHQTIVAGLSEKQLIDLLLRLWENTAFALSDIADSMNMHIAELMDFIERPEVADLLSRLTRILDLRHRHIASKLAPRALATLEAVQNEAESASTYTSSNPDDIRAHREAKAARNQRRLSATVTLNHFRALHTQKQPQSRPIPATDRAAHEPNRPEPNNTGHRPVSPEPATAA